MTPVKMTKILRDIKTVYPSFYRDQSSDLLIPVVDIWTDIFSDDDPKAVEAAVREYIASDETGRPPWPGAIKTILRRKPEKRFIKTGEDDAGCDTGYWENL